MSVSIDSSLHGSPWDDEIAFEIVTDSTVECLNSAERMTLPRRILEVDQVNRARLRRRWTASCRRGRTSRTDPRHVSSVENSSPTAIVDMVRRVVHYAD